MGVDNGEVPALGLKSPNLLKIMSLTMRTIENFIVVTGGDEFCIIVCSQVAG